MRAISILQPWAWLIVHGPKDVENRDWQTGYRGPIPKFIPYRGQLGIFHVPRETLAELAP